jgi:vacuolar-type H+-ATPase subunit F/Vma7
MKFFCIADRESSPGFRLSGVETREVTGKNETLLTLKAAVERPEVGIVLITEKAADWAREEIDRLFYGARLPLILEIPSLGEFRPRKNASDLLKKTLGISIG